MKLIFVFAVTILTVNGLTVHEQWISFKETHGKSYLNIAEEKRRFEIFQNTLNVIKEHNEKYEKGESSYYMGINKFADITDEEFSSMFHSQSVSESKYEKTNLEIPNDFKAPESVDWREQGAVLAVRDQGECTSGYAFATAGALEAQLVINYNQSTLLSAQQIVDCSTGEYFNGGCRGGANTFALTYVAYNGISPESSYPYTGVQGSCKNITDKVPLKIFGGQWVAMDENALIWILSTLGPATVTIYSNPLMKNYEGGIYDDAERCVNDLHRINHGVLAIGYGSENGTDYWLLKNSWGDKWGENGLFKVRRNPSICCILCNMVYVEVNKNPIN